MIDAIRSGTALHAHAHHGASSMIDAIRSGTALEVVTLEVVTPSVAGPPWTTLEVVTLVLEISCSRCAPALHAHAHHDARA